MFTVNALFAVTLSACSAFVVMVSAVTESPPSVPATEIVLAVTVPAVKFPPLNVAFNELLNVRPSRRLLPSVSVPPLAVKSPPPLIVPLVQFKVPDVYVTAPVP